MCSASILLLKNTFGEGNCTISVSNTILNKSKKNKEENKIEVA